MSSWQGVEYTVCEIYLAFFPSNQRDVPSIAYHAVRTFDARITVADALIRHFCDEGQVSEWDSLRTKIGKRSKVRNAIAHGLVTMFGEEPNRKWGVGSSPHDLRNFQGSSNQNDYYTSKELEECNHGLIQLTGDLDKFRASLEACSVLQSRLRLQQGDTLTNNQKAQVVAHTPKVS